MTAEFLCFMLFLRINVHFATGTL